MIAYCKHNGIGLIPWSPLAGGILARPIGAETLRLSTTKGSVFERKVVDGDSTIVNRVEELAKKKNCKMSQVALAWAAAKVDSPIVGANSVQRLHDSLVREITLTPEEIAYLEEPCVLCFCFVATHQTAPYRYEPKVVRGHA